MGETKHSDVIKETVDELYRAGIISKEKYEKFQTLHASSENLSSFPQPVVPLKPDEIKQLRSKEKLSTADLALFLNTTVARIEQFERGTLKPSDAEQKLLNVIRAKGIKEIS